MNSPAQPNRSEQMEIDASAKWPVLVLFGSAVVWLILGGALQLIAAIQLHTPSFLADCEWFTHGRVAPAAQNALVYGWGFNSALGFGLWLMARLSFASLRHGGWLIVAAKFWNLGVLLGVAGIMTGASTSIELLEMPRFVTLLLLGSYGLMGAWLVTTFTLRNTENTYASQWYLFGAVFSFPWLYTLAQVMLFTAPVRGTLQAVVDAWYVSGLYGLGFVPVALAAAYYFLPKILGRPVANYYLAPTAFWWLFFATAFTGGSRLIGGPVPAWLATTGAVANFFLIVPVVIIALNLFGTLRGAATGSVTVRFIHWSLFAFLAASLLNFALSLRGFAITAQFTLITALRDWLLLYGCFSTAMFGAAYFIVPRLTGHAWRSSALITAHLGATALGLLLITATLGWAGWEQGRMLNHAATSFTDITKALTPWFTAYSVGLMLLTIGHLAFFVNFFWSLGARCPVTGDATPAVFRAPPAMEVPSA